MTEESIVELGLNIINSPIALSIITIGVVSFIVVSNNKRYIQVSKIRKKWLNRSFSNMEDVLEDVITLTSSEMDKKVSSMVAKCDRDSVCTNPKRLLELESLLYGYMVGELFRGNIKNEIKRRILKNGFHNLSKAKFKDYCERKATSIYSKVLATLTKRAKLICPNLVIYVGVNFSLDNAIVFYTQIIENHLENIENEKEELKYLNRLNLPWRKVVDFDEE